MINAGASPWQIDHVKEQTAGAGGAFAAYGGEVGQLQ